MSALSPVAFLPVGQTVNLTPSSSGNDRVALGVSSQTARFDLRVFNSSTSIIFFKLGADNTVTSSSSTDIPVAAGSVEVFRQTIMNSVYVSAVVIGSTANSPVYFTVGEGI
jgi:hypothetical protein